MKSQMLSKRFMALLITIFMVVTLFAGMGTTVFAAASSINVAGSSTYGNFETAGVTIKVDNMNFNETATLEYKKTTDSTYKTGHYFVRFDGNHMATSLFNLALNTTYDIKVTLSDPADGVSGTNPYYTTVTTKAEYAIPTALRVVNVANNTQFDAAIRAALPGDELRLDPVGGPYGVDFTYVFNDFSGTAAHPFVITSSSESVKPLITSGITLQYKNYVVLNNLEIHAEGSQGVYMRGSHDNVVRNCYIHDSAPCTGDYTADIMIMHSEETAAPYQYIGNHLIINNVLSDEIHDPLSDTSNAATAGQCYNAVTFLYQPGGFNTVRGNTIYGVVDGINTCGDEGQGPVMGPDELDVLNTWHDQNIDVYDNNIYNCGDDGIQNDGHMVNGREFRNRIGRVMCAITTAPMYPGPFFFVRNYVYGFLEQASKQNTGVAGTIRNCFFYHNTFVERDRSDGTSGYCFYRGEPAQVTDFTYKNNIFYARGRIYNGDCYLDDPSLYYYRNYTMDYNTMYSTRTTDTTFLYKWVSNYRDPLNNSKYTSLASFKSAVGQETNGTYGDPKLDFTAISGYPSGSFIADLKIQTNSAALDKGVVIPGINDNYQGLAPDCGAFESDMTYTTPTPSPTNTPTPTPIGFTTPVTITLQHGVDGYSGGKDQGYMVEQYPNTGYIGAGQSPGLKFRDWNGSTNALIYFDLAGSVPALATIESATLSLYETGTGYTSGNCNIYRIIDPDGKGMWAEGTTSAPNDKNGAAWMRRTGTGDTTTVGWTDKESSSILDSAVTTATGEVAIGTSSGWCASSDLKDDVQAWVTSDVNQGWYVRAVPGSGLNAGEVASDQYATATYRPKLTITYHTSIWATPTATPPTTPVPTNFPMPLVTNTPVLTITPTPTIVATPVATVAPTAINTPIPTPTDTPSPTPTPSNTPTPIVTPTPTPSVMLGDVNNDGKVTAVDALMALQIVTGRRIPTDRQSEAADVNKDGEILSNDALRILQYSTGRITQF